MPHLLNQFRLIFSGCNLKFEIVDDGNFIALRENIFNLFKSDRPSWEDWKNLSFLKKEFQEVNQQLEI